MALVLFLGLGSGLTASLPRDARARGGEALQFTDRGPAVGDSSASEQTSKNTTEYTSALVNNGVVQTERKSERVESSLQRRVVTVKSVKDGRVMAWGVTIRDYETTSVFAGGETKIRKHPLSGRTILCKRELAKGKSGGRSTITIEPTDGRPLAPEMETLLRSSQGFDPFEDPTERAFRDFLQRKPFRVGESRTFRGPHARKLLGFKDGPEDVSLTLKLRRIAKLEEAGPAGEFAALVRAKGTVQPDSIQLDVTMKGTWVVIAGGTLPHSMIMTGKSTLTGSRPISGATEQRLTGKGQVKTSLSNDYSLSGPLLPAPKADTPAGEKSGQTGPEQDNKNDTTQDNKNDTTQDNKNDTTQDNKNDTTQDNKNDKGKSPKSAEEGAGSGADKSAESAAKGSGETAGEGSNPKPGDDSGGRQ